MHCALGLLIGIATWNPTVLASPYVDALIVKEVTSPPPEWVKSATPPSPDHYIILRIGLTQSNFSGLEAALYNVSHPGSPSYGKYLSRNIVLPFLSPTTQTTLSVDSWLSSHDLEPCKISPARDWYTINTTVARAGRLLGANFDAYTNAYSPSKPIIRTTSYQIPHSLDLHIDTIQPTTFFPSAMRKNLAKKAKVTTRHDLESPVVLDPSHFPECTHASSSVVTPWCIKKLYNVGDYTPLASLANWVGISGYLNEYAQRSDLAQYLQLYNPEAAAKNYTFSIVSPTNTPVPQDTPYGNTEANLDIQSVAGLSYPIPSTFYSTAGAPPWNPDENTSSDSSEPYLELLDYLLDATDIPTVLTTSYGDDEQSVPYGYALRVCRGFAALGARGMSVIFSSGDMGVGPFVDSSQNLCLTSDGTHRTMFVPSFPATCPFVTTVGGTQGMSPETAMHESSGGFSAYFSRPSYQQYAVQTYLNAWGSKYASYFENWGRGFPDLSSQVCHSPPGSRLTLYDGGNFNIAYGTSCAAPVVASLVALLNDYRLRNGGKTLGFLNPLLYSAEAQAGFNDITIGNNPGCGTDGFNATKGWDPITGLGTINFGKMKDVVVPKPGSR